MSDLDKDFDKVAEQINAKLKEAAEALSEARKIANEAGLDGLIFTQWDQEDLYRANKYADKPLSPELLNEKIESLQEAYNKIEVRELENELSNSGWNTSSSYC